MRVKALDENLTIGQLGMRVKSLHNLPLARRPRTDLSKTSSKNTLDGLVRPIQELAKSVTGTSIRVRESKAYDEAVNNPINRNKWPKAIDKEL